MTDTIGYIEVRMKAATLQLARTHARRDYKLTSLGASRGITGVKKNSSLDRGLRYRGSTVINSIFVGIRIFQHLNLLLVRFDPISLMHSKPLQNGTYPRLLHLQRCGIVF